MRFYKMRRYQQLVFRTTPDSLLDWLDCELEKRGIDCVYTHCILSILQEDSSDAEPDECIDGRNCHKVYRKLESLYSATKSKHQKWKSYSKQILLSTSIPCFDVDIDNREQKNKVAAINCLKSVSDDNTIEELIDEVCMKLKNIRNIVAPEKKESLKSSNKIDKDTAFYIPPSSPTDQVEKYFAAFPPLNRKEEEKMDSIQVAHLNICYANCIRQSKNIVQDIFINNNSFQNSENSKHKQGFGSLKSIENIYQPENINKTLKCKNSQPSDHNANNFKFTDENGYAGTSFRNSAKFDRHTIAVMNSDRNRDTNMQNCSEKSCIKISRSKNVSQKPRKNVANKSNHRSEKEPDSKRKSLLNAKMYSNAKKAKNSTESYFSSNKFSVLMEEETCKLDIDHEEHNENVIINHSLNSEKVEAFELITNPCKKFKISKNPNALVDTFNDSTVEKEVADSTSIEMSLPCLPKYNCDKELICKNNSCLEDDLTLEMHAEKRKSYENNLFEEIDGIASCKKLSTRTKYFKSITKAKRKRSKSKPKDINNKSNFDVLRYSDKDHCSEGAIKERLRDINDSALKLCDKRKGCFKSETENLYTSKILLHMPEFFLQVKKKDGLSISCLTKMRENINAEQSMCSFFKIDGLKNNPIIFSEQNKIESSQNSNKAPTVTKKISFNNINDSSQGSLYIPLDSKRVSQQNFTFALANINSIIIENNTYYKFNAFKALNYFSPHEIFNIITTGDSNEVNNFLNKFSVQSNFNSYPNSDTLLPDKNVSENFPSIDLKVSGSLPLMKHSSSHLQSIFAPKEQSASIFNIGFQSVEFKDETFYETEYSKDSLPFCYTQQNMVECKNNTPAIFGQWNYNLFLDLSDESSNLSNNGSKCNNLNTKASIAVSDKEIAFMFPNKLVMNESDCSFCPSEQFNSVKSKNSIWNIDNRDRFNNYTTLSTSLICKNNFSETHFSYSGGEICPESKFVCLLKNADDAVSLESISCFSSHSAFENVQKKELPCITHSSVRCQQNLLKKVTNIDRIIHRINAKNRVVSFLNVHSSLKQPLDDRAKTFFHSFSPDSPSDSYKDGINIDDFLSFNSGIAKNDLPSNYNVNLGWSKKCTNSDESLRAIWENNSNPVSIKENKYKPVVTEGIYTLFDNFDLESMQNELEREEDELLKTMYSVSDSKEKNEQIMPNLKFKSSYSLKTNSKNESLELNVEEFQGISVPMPNISAKTTSKISDCSNFDFTVPVSDVDPVGVFSIDNCMNIIDSQATCSDTSYSLNVKDEAYQHSGFIDVSAFRGPYGSYSENKTNYLEGGGWSLDSGDFMLGSDAFHYRSSSLHELEITDAENDSFQHEHSDQQHLSSKDSEMAQLNTTRLPFVNARRRMKHKFPAYKRPCAFFMEGNCSRSDCKYSHDLSNITCRFWTEGSCFKGTTCPFLHGYVEYQKIDHHKYSKSEPKNYYSLDSEADFPSLSSTKSEKTVAAKSLPVDIVCAKRVKNSNLGN